MIMRTNFHHCQLYNLNLTYKAQNAFFRHKWNLIFPLTERLKQAKTHRNKLN